MKGYVDPRLVLQEEPNIIKRAMRIISGKTIRTMARLGIASPLAYLYSKVIIKQVKPRTGKVSADKPVILAINPTRFRGDLEALADSKEFKVLKVPFRWQRRLLFPFWTKPFATAKYYNPGNDKDILGMQQELRKFLKKVLTDVFTRLKVDCVIAAAFYYLQDHDWGAVSSEIGVPYIVLHKENLAASSKLLEGRCRQAKEMGKFNGAHIIVHNETMKDILIRSGYVGADKISALGCLRMDGYIKKIRNAAGVNNDRIRKKVTLFSFQHGVGLGHIMSAWSEDGIRGFVGFFEHVHAAVARLAVRNQGVDFVIKPKWGGSWIDMIKDAIRKNGMDADNIKNLRIIVDIDPQDLILESDVICGFGSTTLLEAAVALKPVIIPYFAEALDERYAGYVILKENFNLFDIAHSRAEFEELILKRLADPALSNERVSGRYELFEKYVSSSRGDALDKYVKCINNVIKRKDVKKES